MRIVLTVAAVLLAVELALNTVSALAGLGVWRQRLHDIARLDLPRRVELLVGLACLLGLAALVAGLWSTPALAGGGVLALLGAGTVLARQLRHGDRGRTLASYVAFTASSLLVIVLAPLR